MRFDEYIKTEDALFHYTRTAIAIEKILYKKELKLPLLNGTNDPREYKGNILIGFGGEGPQRQHINKTFDCYREVQEAINIILKSQCRVACFCSNEKPILVLDNERTQEDEYACSPGWSKSRMWSQYGDNHYGICLVFSKKALIASLEEHSQSTKYKAAYIRYSQNGCFDHNTITLNRNRLEEDEHANEYAIDHVYDNADDLLFRKHIDYRDESEYRIIVFDLEKEREFLDVQSSLRGVIIGDRTPEAYTLLINGLCDDIGIRARKASWSRGEPNLRLSKPQDDET